LRQAEKRKAALIRERKGAEHGSEISQQRVRDENSRYEAAAVTRRRRVEMLRSKRRMAPATAHQHHIMDLRHEQSRPDGNKDALRAAFALFRAFAAFSSPSASSSSSALATHVDRDGV